MEKCEYIVRLKKMMDKLRAVVETLIFASDMPLTAEKIRDLVPDVELADIRKVCIELAEEYEKRNGGIFLAEVAGGYQFRTRTDLAEWVKKLKGIRGATLSQAALETLAVIAYRQPIMKAEIEKVRGVDVSGTLKGLMEKKLVRIVGRKDVPGRPIIYGTTRKFLEVFQLTSLLDLPTLKELED